MSFIQSAFLFATKFERLVNPSMPRKHELFVRMPHNLFDYPEVVRYFDGALSGAMYRLLSSEVRRVGRNHLKFYNEAGWLSQLSDRYSVGFLTCYFTDKDLAERMLVGESTIRKLRLQLKELELVTVEKFSDGYIYTVGQRSKNLDETAKIKWDGEYSYLDRLESLLLESEESQMSTRLKMVDILVDSTPEIVSKIKSGLKYIPVKKNQIPSNPSFDKSRHTNITVFKSLLRKYKNNIINNIVTTPSGKISETENDSLFDVETPKPKKSKAGLMEELQTEPDQGKARLLYHEVIGVCEDIDDRHKVADVLSNKVPDSHSKVEYLPLYSLEESFFRPEYEKNPYLEVVYKFSAMQTDAGMALMRNITPGKQPQWKVMCGIARTIVEKFGLERTMWTLRNCILGRNAKREEVLYYLEDITRLYVMLNKKEALWNEYLSIIERDRRDAIHFKKMSEYQTELKANRVAMLSA